MVRLCVRLASCLVMICVWNSVTPSSAFGEETSWVGKKIATKNGKIRIGYTDENDVEQYVSRLTDLVYVVEAEQGAFIKVREHGVSGWFAKADAVLFEDAIPYFTGRIRRNEKDADAYARRGIAWDMKSEHDIALKDYNEAIRLLPEEASWFNNRGMIWRKKKEYDKALADYDEAIRLDSKFVKAFYNRGSAYSGKKDYDRAIKDYDEAIRLDPKTAVPVNNRGNAYSAKKDYDRAIKDYDEAIRLDPKYGYSYGNRACARSKMKQYTQAVRDFEEALRLSPSMDWLHRDYAFFRATCPEASYRDGKKAVDLAKRAIELAGKDVDWEYHAALAAACAETGEFDKSVAEQTKALEDKSLDREDRSKMERRLKLYREKKPYRDAE